MTSDASSSPNRNEPVFLGEYLVRLGFVTEPQLAAALALQKEVNLKLGECAVDLGFLSRADALAVYEAQRTNDVTFGVLAVKLGKLTRLQLEQALEYQRFKHLRIGEALVKLGAISAPLLEQAAKAFEDLWPKPAAKTAAEPASKVAESELVDCTQRLLVRVAGLRTKQTPWEPLDAGPRVDLLTTGIQLNGRARLGLWISVSRVTGAALAKGLLPGFEGHDVGHLALDELVNMVCGHAVSALEKVGLHWSNCPPKRGWPELHTQTGHVVTLVAPDDERLELRVTR